MAAKILIKLYRDRPERFTGFPAGWMISQEASSEGRDCND